MKPTIARLAEREPELIIPFSKLGKGGGMNVNIALAVDARQDGALDTPQAFGQKVARVISSDPGVARMIARVRSL